jgi:hypothetical protein
MPHSSSLIAPQHRAFPWFVSFTSNSLLSAFAFTRIQEILSTMAKSRADGTPAKAGRKTSPAESTKASPAKPTKSKSASPERTTRSSPRRTVPSVKAQEAAADHVQTGRVTKKTSPSKGATPAKKASPEKTTKAVTPAKEASPEKATKSATPGKKVVSAKSSPSKSSPVKLSSTKTTPMKTKKETLPWKEPKSKADEEHMDQEFVFYSDLVETLAIEDPVNADKLVICYDLLFKHKAELDGNARPGDDERTRQHKKMYRKVKKAMRTLLGAGLDACVKNNIERSYFNTALRTGLQSQGVIAPTATSIRRVFISRDSMPSIRLEDAVEDSELERERRSRHEKHTKDLREAKARAQLAYDAFQGRVAAGRVGKPSNRVASRSRSPAKSPTKREREASVSRPVRAHSQSPKKAATRTTSKSPAPIERLRTRSRSPAEIAKAQPTGTGRKSRSRSPAKAPTRQASKSPAPIEKAKARARSPAKARQSSPPPLAVAKTRSKSPVKANASQSPSAGRTRGTPKSPGKKDSLYHPTGNDDLDEEDESGKSPRKGFE